MKLNDPVDDRILISLLLLLILFAGGTIGYSIIEGYSITEGLYMTIITVTTVGFGEVKPLSDQGRLFTSFLILIGFASLAFVGHHIVETILQKIINSKSENRRMKKNISLIKSHFIICGFGRVGASAANILYENDAKFVIIESNPANIPSIQEKNYLFVEGNATDEEVLKNANIKKAAGLLATLPSDPDNLYITLTAREMNPTLHIITRAQQKESEKKLLQAGADSVISLYSTAGKQIAEDMLSGTGKTPNKSINVERNLKAMSRIIEIKQGSGMIGQYVGDISKEMGREIYGVRRSGRDFLLPDKTLKIQVDDKLFIIDEQEEYIENQSLKNSSKKIVIVDDNPIILRLFTRLLQRAGFVPITASNGQDALNLILDKKPDAAIIDFMLPVMSGIEICEAIRKDSSYDKVKLILFTSDQDSKTKKRALDAGANAVVVKGVEAQELIETVVNLLKKDISV